MPKSSLSDQSLYSGYAFSDLTGRAERFFGVLPDDWREGIAPYWHKYEESTNVYVLEKENRIAGGGLVFSTPAPDTLTYKEEAEHWFDQGYLYIGFLWIDEQFRNQRLGSYWLRQLFARDQSQRFWLAIEEEDLAAFYQKNGFYVKKTIHPGSSMEWIMLRD